MVGEDASCNERGGEAAGDRLRVLVEEEATIGVAVERDADVGVLTPDGLLQIAQVLRLDRVGRMVRERAVELEVEGDELHRELVEDRGNDLPTHPVRRIDRDD